MQDKIFVYRVIDGKAKATRVEVTPLPEENTYIVNNGLKAGEQIVSEGVGLLQEGANIIIKE